MKFDSINMDSQLQSLILRTLEEKEAELSNRLSEVPLYKEWQDLKDAISKFKTEQNIISNPLIIKANTHKTVALTKRQTVNIPYSKWAEKILIGEDRWLSIKEIANTIVKSDNTINREKLVSTISSSLGRNAKNSKRIIRRTNDLGVIEYRYNDLQK